MEPLIILTHIAIILLIGILCSLLAKTLKLPNPLLLVLVGMFLGSLSFNGTPLIEVDQTFIIGLGTLGQRDEQGLHCSAENNKLVLVAFYFHIDFFHSSAFL